VARVCGCETPYMNEHMGTTDGRYYYVPNSYMNEYERKARPISQSVIWSVSQSVSQNGSLTRRWPYGSVPRHTLTTVGWNL